MSYSLLVSRGAAVLLAIVVILALVATVALAAIGAVASLVAAAGRFVRWLFTAGDPLVP